MASSESSETKCIITGLLTSNPVRCTIKQLCNDFTNFVGYKIPIRQLGFNNVEDYLRSIPDTVVVYGSGPTAEVQGIIKPKSAHINEMVVKQKKNSVPKHKRSQVRSFPRQPPRPLFSGYISRPPPNFNAYTCSASSNSVSSSYSSNTSCESRSPNTRKTPSPFEPIKSLPSTVESPSTPIETRPTPIETPPSPIETRPTLIGTSPTPIESPPKRIELPPTSVQLPPSPIEPFVNNENGRLVNYDSSSSENLDDYESKIPPRIQNNLRKLILQFPDGIWCTKLPVEYHKMYKRKLSYENYGYRSLIEMCSDLPEIFRYVQPTSDDFILYDKNKPIPPLDQNDTATNYQQAGETVATRNIMNEVHKLPWELGPALIPSDVLHLGDRISRYAFSSELQVGEYLDVCVGEIYDVSKFWVYLAFGDLKGLMSDLQNFFRTQRNKYVLPELLLEEGLYCTCLYAGEYHRAVIVNLLPKLAGFVRVLFIDYGTVGNVQSSEIWYLPKQFSTIPCQAIRARLSNIYPPYENRPWSIQAVNRFRELITNTALVAEITVIDKDDNILEIYLADITDENHIFYVNDVLVKEGHALFTGQERKQTLIDPNCIPNVEYIHLYPEFYEIEGGYAPTTPEMNYILENKLPMHFYMPQYFDIYYREDINYIEEQHEKCNKVVPNFKIKPVIVKQDFDFSFFPDDLVDEMKALVIQEEAIKSAKPKPGSDQNKIVPKLKSCGDGEKPTTGSVKEYFCNKRRISELIHGDKKADSGRDTCPLQADTRQYSRSSSVLSRSLDISQEEIVPLNNSLINLNLNNSDRSVISNSSKSFKSTNPFMSEDFMNASNPFHRTAHSTNPFLNSLEDTINTSDLFEIFSKSSEEKLQDKIVNNLNESSCTHKLNKQLNVDRANTSDNLASPNTLNSMVVKTTSVENSFKSPEKRESRQPRRVRTPPGFSSANHQNPPWNTNYNNYYPNYNNFMPNFPNNPYYQRFPSPEFNSNFSMLQNNPTLMQNYYNFIPQIFSNVPGSFQFNLQYLQQALGGPNRQLRPPFNNYGPYYNNK